MHQFQFAISNGDAEKLLKIAQTRCGPESSASVQQIQMMLQQYVDQQAAASYAASRNVLCQAVQVGAQLAYRYNQYQSVKANGITLKSFEKTEKFSFPTTASATPLSAASSSGIRTRRTPRPTASAPKTA
ncbi:MAG: hypothetical protein ACK4NA_05445 [Alphaproteobacteria bacterium]